MKGALPLLALVACADPPKELIVTVDARPTVHDVKTLHVTLGNAGGTVSQDLDLGSHPFPVTFAVEAPGRTGDLTVSVDAIDTNMLVVGTGTGTGAITDPAASVTLDGTDFVVNTDFANDQVLASGYEAYGYQLSALADGTWFVTYHADCFNMPCPLSGRRFDATGKPLQSDLAASDKAFEMTTTVPNGSPDVALASSGQTTVAAWNFQDASMASGIACRSYTASGGGLTSQVTVSNDNPADTVTATALSNLNVAVSWYQFGNPDKVRGVVVRPDCSVAAGPFTVSTTTTAIYMHRPSVAASSTAVMYAWISDDEVRFRVASNGGLFTVPDAILIPKTATDGIDFVRVAPLGTGFAVLVRWSQLSGAGTTKIELYKTDLTGKLVSGPTVLTQVPSPEFNLTDGFGVTTRADGALMAVWHDCNAGDGNGCGVFGRVVHPTGVPVGPVLTIPSTLSSDQTGPSVVGLPGAFAVAWTDKSGAEPDHSGTAVRARIIAPPYADAAGILGGSCPCSTGLGCGLGSDGKPRCFETCTPPLCANGGTCKAGTDTANVCTF